MYGWKAELTKTLTTKCKLISHRAGVNLHSKNEFILGLNKKALLVSTILCVAYIDCMVGVEIAKIKTGC